MQMTRSMKKKLGAVVVLGAMTIGGFAIAASNTGDPSNAGQAAPDVGGFTVTDIDYAASDPSTPNDVDSVSFDIVRDEDSPSSWTPAVVKSEATVASQTQANTNALVYVRVELLGTWFPCDVVAGRATCDLSSGNYGWADIDQLEVVAYDYTPVTVS